jgi:hypothetical protein
MVDIARALSRFREKRAVDALTFVSERTTPAWEYDNPVFSAAIDALLQIGGSLGASAIWHSLQKCAHPRTVAALERILAESPSVLADDDLSAIARTEWLTAKYVKSVGPIQFGDPDVTETVIESCVQVPTLCKLARAEVGRRNEAHREQSGY